MRIRPILAVLAAVVLVAIGWWIFRPSSTPTPVPIQGVADRIVVRKAAHRMTLWRDGRVLREYQVALGRGGLGPKERAGDGKVPEGVYRITGRNPRSAYHLSLRIGYPTPAQAALAQSRGVDPGSDIMIHGLPNGAGWTGSYHRSVDWTAGCIAVTDAEVEEIWRAVPDGTLIEIRP